MKNNIMRMETKLFALRTVSTIALVIGVQFAFNSQAITITNGAITCGNSPTVAIGGDESTTYDPEVGLTILINGSSVSYQGSDYGEGAWNGSYGPVTESLDVGQNVFTATDNYGGSANLGINVTQDANGNIIVWSYIEGDKLSCGFMMDIVVSCVSPNTYYSVVETIESSTPCLHQQPPAAARNIESWDDHTLHIPDMLLTWCPSSGPTLCNGTVNKTWHVSIGGSELTSSADVVTSDHETQPTPHLIFKDSQCDPPQTF